MANDETATEETVGFSDLLSSVRIEGSDDAKLTPMIQDNLGKVIENAERDKVDISEAERFAASLAAVVHNMPEGQDKFDKQDIKDLVNVIDTHVSAQLDSVLHQPEFQQLEAAWQGIADLCAETNFNADIQISLLDVGDDEIYEDLELNSADIAGSELFKKLYVAEYDQYGGSPYGAIVGLWEFENSKKDRLWIQTMGKIATACHAPFVASASPKFFGCSKMSELNQLRDIEGMMNMPKYGAWNKLRGSEEAAYIGLTLPRYMVRPPYNDETNPASDINYNETVNGADDDDFTWGSTGLLFARNLVKSFETSGWCQYIRGPKGGGMVAGLPTHSFNIRGEDELKPPVEVALPDFRELELANAGFIPLIHKKGTADGVFFSAQSIKRFEDFEDPIASSNSRLVTNLAYTYSVSRIAHYLKRMMRDNIGSSANRDYVFGQIDRWISGFCTSLVNPDDLTLRYYPFKAYSLEVNDVEGKPGWYHCNLSILPHIQFEGMDVDLRVDASLG